MKKRLLVLSVLFLAILGGFFIYPKLNRFLKARPVQNSDALRAEILSSINNPFHQADTLILATQWKICGNSDPDDLPVVFDTKLEEDSFKHLLAKQIQKPVLTQNEFNKIMDTVLQLRFHGTYPPSLWDTCRLGKVAADIKAEQLSPHHIRLQEDYLYADSVISIQKDFVFDRSKWTYTITDSSARVLAR